MQVVTKQGVFICTFDSSGEWEGGGLPWADIFQLMQPRHLRDPLKV